MDYKMLMIIMDENLRDDVEVVLERHGIEGFSEIPTVLGEGRSGKKLDSRLHPGANSIVFSIVPASVAQTVKEDLLHSCLGSKDDENCKMQLHIGIINVEDFV